jgi:parallel beta-helix repeat protein
MMTYQGSLIQQPTIHKMHTTPKAIASLQVSLTALWFWVGGTAILPAGANDAHPSSHRVTTASQVAQIPAGATILYVNSALGTDGSGAGSNEGAPYRSITYALQQAKANTVIQLAPGSYTKDTGEVFPLVVKPGVILRGDEANKGQTVLVIGSGPYVSPTFASQNVTIRAERSSEVRGLTVTNPSSRGTALWVESTNPGIRNNTFSNSLRDGIFVTGTGAPVIADNVFTQNKGNGVSLARAAQGEIRGNLFQNTGFGIAIGGTSAPTIEGNQVIQNTDGIVVSDSARPVLRKNVIESNTRDGVVAITNAQPDLGTAENPGSNTIQNNGRYDLYNATRSNTIVAVGNQINPQRISGLVDFVAAELPPPDGGSTTSQFRDVQGHWAQAFIGALAAQNIISGFPDGTYRPSAPVTRAQFAAIINKAFNPAAQRSAINFVDVGQSFWGYQAIQTAYRGGFLAGYPGNVFLPDQQIPRVQVLVSLANGLKYSATDTSALTRYYTDAAQIPSYAIAPVTAATQRNIVINYPTLNQLSPNREATRAEVAAFVYQALVNSGRVAPINSPYVVIGSQP